MRNASSIAPLVAVLLVAFAAKFDRAMMAAAKEQPAAITTEADPAQTAARRDRSIQSLPEWNVGLLV